MHPADIQALMAKAGHTFTSIAGLYGVSVNAIRMSILGRKSAIGESRLAAAINMPPQELWPDRYTKDGIRINPVHGRVSGLLPRDVFPDRCEKLGIRELIPASEEARKKDSKKGNGKKHFVGSARKLNGN